MKNKLFNFFFTFFNKFYTFFLIFLGTIIVSWMIWSRFIRERLPKDIPFELTEIKFYLLLYICFIYFYIVKNLLLPKNTHPFIAKFVKIFYLPLVTLDESIKQNKYFLPIYNKILLFALKRSYTYTGVHMIMLYFTYNILPRIFLITLLIIDVFYFSKISLLYDFILIGLIPLFHRYMKHSFKYAKEQYLKYLNANYRAVTIHETHASYLKQRERYLNMYDTENWKPCLYDDKTVSIEEYLDIQTENYFEDDEDEDKREYELGSAFSKPEVYEEYFLQKYNKYDPLSPEITSEDITILKEDFVEIMPELLSLNIHIKLYSIIPELNYIKYTRVIIYSLYLICWTYILYVSYLKMNKEFIITKEIIRLLTPYVEYYVIPLMNYLLTYIDQIEPFSQLFL